MYTQGHLAILKGNLAPEGCVAKITGLKNPAITGPARVFDSENDVHEGDHGEARSRRATSIVIRYEGPKGGPGMQEMLAPTSALIGQGLGESVGPHHRRALLRRHLGHGGRPRRARGLRRRHHRAGEGGRLDHHRRAQAPDPAERARRRSSPRAAKKWKPPKPRYTRGLLAKYMRLVSTASEGRDHRRGLTTVRKGLSRRGGSTGGP